MTKVSGIVAMAAIAIAMAACSGEYTKNLGVHNGKLADCPSSPNCVSSWATDSRHSIAPLAFTDPPKEAFLRLKKVLTDRKDTQIVEEEPGYLRVVFSTTFFSDDGEFLLEKDHIAVRSASRLGYSDFGKNRSRLEAISRSFSQPLDT